MIKSPTSSLNLIPKLAQNLGNKLKGGEILALIGPLGSGKTTFVKALGKQLKIKRPITSPTFALLNCFSGKLKSNKPVLLYHLDLYRAKNFQEVKNLGLMEFLGKPGTVTLIEWGDKIKKYLPEKTKIINF